MTLAELTAGQRGEVLAVGGEGALRQHLLDMGVIPGTRLRLIKYAPMGDPLEVRLHGYELTLRKADAEQIEIRVLESDEEEKVAVEHVRIEHPGFGESGRFHRKEDEQPLPKGTTLSFALVGNQNSGKTTLFNRLTGANQHVGNFPGVTVDKKSGTIKNHPETEIVDMPGIYSLSPYSGEEMVSRRYILEEKPSCIINIVDATNLERNLYLTMQLLELDVPMVLALNMMDEVRADGGHIHINQMEQILGIPVVPIAAARNEGVDELVNHALHIAKYREKPKRYDFCDKNDHGGAVHRCLHGIMHLIEDHSRRADIPLRFAAAKLAENDTAVFEALDLSDNEKEMIERIVGQMEDERGLDRAAAIADMRFAFIKKVAAETVVKPDKNRGLSRSSRIDKILTGRFTAIPAFVLIMAAVFLLTFNVIGAFLQRLLESGIGQLTEGADALLAAWHVNPILHSLVVDGVFTGVGSVLSFVPIIVTLFFFLSLLEDSGYMARVAFVMDKLLRRIGLSGRSIVPLLIGFGCSVPAIMAGRTLPSERDRKLTIVLTPFMSCTAKLPIYAFFIAAFFPAHGGVVMCALYFGGIAVGVLTALLFKKTLFRGEAVPFVMELPNYRLPGAKNVLRLLWDKAKDFLERAFTIIFIATIIIWFLQTFDFRFNIVADGRDSILASLAGVLSPIFRPLGFGSWQITTALISGFIAKESVVSTLAVLFGSAAELTAMLTPLAAASLLTFCLLYTPCVAAIASVKRELGAKWALFVVVFQCGVAWLCALLVRAVGLLLGVG